MAAVAIAIVAVFALVIGSVALLRVAELDARGPQ